MSIHDLLIALVVITALRVFTPDVRALTRRLLSAGVRIGATELMGEDHNASAPATTALPPVSRRGEK
ncbi:hypothetical protein ACFWGM_33760 [Streptomyces roseolus]|uniref:hypothetical protein n=1 Tax=Streptomyces roseolus TaxID=67358 RepID=UPI0036366C45